MDSVDEIAFAASTGEQAAISTPAWVRDLRTDEQFPPDRYTAADWGHHFVVQLQVYGPVAPATHWIVEVKCVTTAAD